MGATMARQRVQCGWLFGVALCVLLSDGGVAAQGVSGQIEGTVRDAQGLVLPAATLTLRNAESGVLRTIVTDSDGAYRFAAVPPGRYTMRAELSGFATQEVRDITLTIGLTIRQDFSMAVQVVAEAVTVTAASPVVDTTKAEVSGMVTREQIAVLPINSRQYLSLALLMPGTTQDGTRSFFATVNVGGAVTFNSTGQHRRRGVQQLAGRRRTPAELSRGCGGGVQGQQRAVQSRIRARHRWRHSGRHEVGHRFRTRLCVRILP